MPRLPRSLLPDGIFHVTARGVAKAPIFLDDFDYAEFERRLLKIGNEYAWRLHAYCLLPNHYHLIVEARQSDLTTGMHSLNGGHAQRFNRKYDRVGHVFQNRFSSYVIETEEHFFNALAYVRANPVAAGLCRRPRDWRWSGGVSDADVF